MRRDARKFLNFCSIKIHSRKHPRTTFFRLILKNFMKSLFALFGLIILLIIVCFILGYSRESIRERLREERELLKHRKKKLILVKNKKEHFKLWRDWIYKKSVPIAGAFIMVAFCGITYLIGSTSGNIKNLSEFIPWTAVTESFLIVLLWFKYHKVVEMYTILNDLAPKMRVWIFGKRRINIDEQIQFHAKEITSIDMRITEINEILS